MFELWISLRNVLVHGYAVIDPERLLEALSEIDELDRVINEISSFIRDRSIDPLDNQLATSNEELTGLINKARQVLEGFDFVLFEYVFGSRAIGRARPESDLDIVVFTGRELDWKELMSIMITLEDTPGLKVDLIHLNKASLSLAYEVVSRGVLILDRDPDRRIDFETRIIKEFLNFKPRLAQYYNAVLNP
ncbi:MAG: type VII toxin-antitoxin system MntA family adenylyltransferase antitoxin [Vulcanisaeta sp.]